jgi:NAD(P)-dependent dehydrogenase (short-subunit alcohol dehydrogenase family)
MAAAQGYAVGLSYRSSEEPARQVVEEIRRAGGRALAMKADSASPAETAAFFAAVDRELGRVTALVNNAGITGPISRIEALDPAALDQVLAINVKGCFLALREAILRMATDLGGQGGAVVNVSSRASEIGGANEWVHYAASKGAVDTFTVGASRELAPRGIRVNAVNPGLIDTEIHAKAGGGRARRLRAPYWAAWTRWLAHWVRRASFCTLPVAVCGSSFTTTTSSGIHHLATLPS